MDEAGFDLLVLSLDETDRVGYVSEIGTPIDIVVTRPRTGVHLEIQAVRVRVVATNVVQAGAKLERPFQRCLEPAKLPAADKGTEVIHARLDLPGGIDPRESLLPVDLHEREIPE